ncbi:hypothetical protein MMC17_002813 [Xylographa soralifera]|nr:hypothetical protein [Xylographa soralifera]
MPSKAKVRLFAIFATAFFVLLTITLLFSSVNTPDILATHSEPSQSPQEPPPEPTPVPHHKPIPSAQPPIKDNFPLTASALPPPIPFWNALPANTNVPQTPLLIAFTRNWPLLQQTVVSYITAGWPASQIFVIDNSGTQDSNKRNLLTLQNPFYLNYHRLTAVYNVTVLETPVLLTFAQVQNYFLHLAIKHDWSYYFWGHQDAVALSDETYTDPETGAYKSLYARVLDTLAETLALSYSAKQKWAIRFFAYDHLALVSREAYLSVGGWDPFISYYISDCDMHERLAMADYRMDDAHVGTIYDLSTSLDDLLLLYRRSDDRENLNDEDLSRRGIFSSSAPDISPLGALGDDGFYALKKTLDDMDRWKNDNKINPAGRNTWQARQQGGQGEPFYYDAEGFSQAIDMANQNGKRVYEQKWDGGGCGLSGRGLKATDAWRVGPDPEPEPEPEPRSKRRQSEDLVA